MSDLKQLARRIFQETLSGIEIPVTMQRKLQREGMVFHCNGAAFDLRHFQKVRVIAMGKAAQAMLVGLKYVLPAEIEFKGIASVPVPPSLPLENIQYFLGGHPIPNEQSLLAARAMLALLSGCDGRTLVFFVLSGGGSALVELSLDPALTLRDMQLLHHALVTCGASIDDINTVRKHVSAVKGGRLALAAGSATKITLAVSDVPVGRESALASGPTLPDPTTVADARRIINHYLLDSSLPAELLRRLLEGQMPETPKADDRAFDLSHFILLLGLDDLFHHAHRAAEAIGFLTSCDNSTDDQPVEAAAKYLLGQLENLRNMYPGRRVALIADGELSSPVRGNGVGGRNSAFVLSCVEKIAGQRIAVLSAGTDGIDGNSPAAGAVADATTLARACEAGMDPADAIRRSDAFTFFDRLGDAVVTGPTGNNLRDLRILIAEP